MYQRQEFIIKKNTEVVKKVDGIIEEAYKIRSSGADVTTEEILFNRFFAGTEPYDYIMANCTEEEREIYQQSNYAENFYLEHVRFYIDMVKSLSGFEYTTQSCGRVRDKKDVVEVKVTETDNETETRILIEEYWDGDFMQNVCASADFNNGLRIGYGYHQVPRAMIEIIIMVNYGMYLWEKYSEEYKEMDKVTEFNCFRRMFDVLPNGEGAIGFYNHETNKYEKIGYGKACNGWSGEEIKNCAIDRSYLRDNPDKIWYSVNPANHWYPFGPIDKKYTDEWKSEFDSAFSKIPEKYRNKIYSTDEEEGCFYYNDAGYDNYWTCEWHFFDEKDCDSANDEIMKFTGNDILELISICETFNEDLLKLQIHSCERVGADTEPILDDGWWCQMLFYNNDGEILYITSEDDRDDAGRRTGKLTVHRKCFRI